MTAPPIPATLAKLFTLDDALTAAVLRAREPRPRVDGDRSLATRPPLDRHARRGPGRS